MCWSSCGRSLSGRWRRMSSGRSPSRRWPAATGQPARSWCGVCWPGKRPIPALVCSTRSPPSSSVRASRTWRLGYSNSYGRSQPVDKDARPCCRTLRQPSSRLRRIWLLLGGAGPLLAVVVAVVIGPGMLVWWLAGGRFKSVGRTDRRLDERGAAPRLRGGARLGCRAHRHWEAPLSLRHPAECSGVLGPSQIRCLGCQ